MKKILFFILCFFVSITTVDAFSIDTIDMNIVLDESGKATITETWETYVDNGSEIYHPYYNLGEAYINVLAASMDGESYEIVDNWNESGNLIDKAHKAGIYENEHGGYDVVVGKTTYGNHTYVFTYEIVNFIANLNDSDMLYWTLIPSDFEVDSNVTIKITGPYEYPDTLDVWGFGLYGAPCYVENGAIYMTSDGRKPSGSNMVLLAKYPQGTFSSEMIFDNDFDYYLEMAQEGADIYKENKTTLAEHIFNFIVMIGQVIFWIVLVMIGLRAVNKNKVNYDFGPEGKTLPKDVNNFRDIPCNKDVYRAFWVADTYELIKSTNKNNFMGVLLLKWIYNNNVKVETITEKKLFKTENLDVIVFDHMPESATKLEQDLYNYMNEASGDGKLEKNEFKKWCKNHYNKILDWSDKVLEYERGKLVEEHSLVDVVTKKGVAFKYDVHSYRIEPVLREEAIQMKGLKKFLTEFSQINHKEPIEVKLWNEYLMYAQIFGIADQVMKKFKDLYPEVVADMDNYNFNYNTFVFINDVSTSGVNAASAARQAAQNYSSGGGGFSSGGGGGGSFGGGFGGGSGSR